MRAAITTLEVIFPYLHQQSWVLFSYGHGRYQDTKPKDGESRRQLSQPQQGSETLKLENANKYQTTLDTIMMQTFDTQCYLRYLLSILASFFQVFDMVSTT